MFSAVLDAIDDGHLDAEFEFVFVNRERGQTVPTDSFLDLVKVNSIPLVTRSSMRFRRERGNSPWETLRSDFELEMLTQLKGFTPDVSVMAGFMLFTPAVSRQMLLLNQHPALPSGAIGKWQDAIWDVIEKGEELHGAMMHVATPELDRGPVVSMCSFPVQGPDYEPLWKDVRNRDIAKLKDAGDESLPLFVAIRDAGVKREPHLVVETLKAVAEGAVDLRAIIKDDINDPIDLTDKVESALARIGT